MTTNYLANSLLIDGTPYQFSGTPANGDVVKINTATDVIEPLTLTGSVVTYDETLSGLGSTVQAAIDSLNDAVQAIGGGNQASGNWLVSGGGVAWSEDYVFEVAAATYYIQGTLYSSPQTTVTLDAADPTDDRFDSIVVNTSGTVAVIKGTASGTPEVPSHDPATQLVLNHVLVEAATTAPPSITTEDMYLENAGTPSEWTFAASAGTIIGNGTTTPYAGTYCIQGTSVASSTYFTLTNNTTIDARDYAALVFYIRPTSAWVNGRSIAIRAYNGTSAVGVAVTIANGNYGFRSNTIAWQVIVIPVSFFAIPAGTLLTTFRWTVQGSSTAPSFRIDNVQLQADTVQQPSTSDGISSINGLVNVSQTIEIGTAGTDVAIVSAGSTHTINVPSASASARGVITTGAQTLAGVKTFSSSVNVTEVVSTPSGTTQAIDLASANHQTLVLSSASGAVTATLTPPSGASAGTILVKQGATVRDITWAAASGSIVWLGTEPDWGTDSANKIRVVSWRHSVGDTTLYLSATAVNA